MLEVVSNSSIQTLLSILRNVVIPTRVLRAPLNRINKAVVRMCLDHRKIVENVLFGSCTCSICIISKCVNLSLSGCRPKCVRSICVVEFDRGLHEILAKFLKAHREFWGCVYPSVSTVAGV